MVVVHTPEEEHLEEPRLELRSPRRCYPEIKIIRKLSHYLKVPLETNIDNIVVFLK